MGGGKEGRFEKVTGCGGSDQHQDGQQEASSRIEELKAL